MMTLRTNRFCAALLLILTAVLLGACAGRETTHQVVLTEYFLKEAGFQQWDVNMATTKRQALLESLPRGKIVTYQMNGETYHAYADEAAKTLYIGDEAAYQKYLDLSKGRRVCERVVAADSSQFWSCYDEFQKAGGK